MSWFSFKVQVCPWEQEHRTVNPRHAGDKTAPGDVKPGRRKSEAGSVQSYTGPSVCEPSIVSSRWGFRGYIVLCCLHWDSWNHWITNQLLGKLTYLRCVFLFWFPLDFNQVERERLTLYTKSKKKRRSWFRKSGSFRQQGVGWQCLRCGGGICEEKRALSKGQFERDQLSQTFIQPSTPISFRGVSLKRSSLLRENWYLIKAWK